MNNLLQAINNSKETKQRFAEIIKMPYSRLTTILYGYGDLTNEESRRIKQAFGEDIFLYATTQKV